VDEDEPHVPSSDPRIHAIAGASAGIMEHCGMFPIDTVKTHQQVTGSRSIRQTIKSIIAKNGVWGLFRGMPVVLGGSAPVHGLSFSVYELCKRLTGANEATLTGHHVLATSFSGVVAMLSHDACITPVDTVKQRLQYGGKPYKGVFDCIRQIFRGEGIAAFYRGYVPTLTMNLPYASVYFGSYESVKKFLKTSSGKKDDHDVFSHLLAGACGGCLAGGVTTPLDVPKTKLQMGEDAGGTYKGFFSTLRRIKEEEGWRGYTKGLKARMIFHSMSGAICWTTYEWVKHCLERVLLAQQNPK